MAPGTSGSTADPREAWAVLGPFLSADPVAQNAALTMLTALVQSADSAAAASAGATPTVSGFRSWWLIEQGVVIAAGLQDRPTRPMIVTAADRSAAAALAAFVAAGIAAAVSHPDVSRSAVSHPPARGNAASGRLPGVAGRADIALAFAATWACNRATPARVALAQCLYRLDTLTLPPPTQGTHRPATDADLDLVTMWMVGFQHDTFGPGPVDLDEIRTTMATKIALGLTWLWVVDEAPVAVTSSTPTVAGTARIQGVYTPAEHRGRGYATALVAAVVADRQATANADHCVLYADLANPTSNAIYQRLGFTAHSEHLNCDFG